MKVRDAVDARAALGEELRKWNRIGAEAAERLSLLWGELSPRKAKKRDELRATVDEAMRKIEEISRQRQSVLLDADD